MLTAAHLDEDALSAFIEGRLTESESAPVISHLVSCGFCRRITAQLVRLDSETSAAEPDTPPSTEAPGRIRRLLQDLAERVLPSADDGGDAVFAYHAPAEDFRRKDEAGTGSEDETAEESRPENQSDPEANK
jgi:hypothetical protein